MSLRLGRKNWVTGSLVLLLFMLCGLTASAATAATIKKRAKVLQPTYSDVVYGPYSSNLLDFWQAESVEPSPVLIFFHGGGFVSGDKDSMKADLRLSCLENGISVVSANYRMIPEATFPDFMMDGARAIQFVRSKAVEWHINPERIALAGGSAGANMSLWLGLHDDLADQKAADPVARLSTRVSAILSFNGQTSNDPYFILQNIGGGTTVHPSIFGFYGVNSLADMERADKAQLAYTASAINYVSPDDPPVYMTYEGNLFDTPYPADTLPGVVIHSPRFGVFLKEKLDAAGVVCVFHHPDQPDADGEQIAFLLRYLKP